MEFKKQRKNEGKLTILGHEKIRRLLFIDLFSVRTTDQSISQLSVGA